MPDQSGFKALLSQIKGWATQNSSQYIFSLIPKAQTDTHYDDQPLVPMRDYFRIWLTEMSLAKSRNWFVDWFPAVHSSVQLKVVGQQGVVTFSHVAQGPDNALARGVFVNYAVTDLLPYMGGLVEVESALLALKGENYLQSTIKVLQDFASLVAPPLSQAVAVAEKLSTGVQNLFNATQGQVHLGWHQTFASQGGGGQNVLKPGYLAVILATKNELKPEGLSVKQDRLYYTKAAGGTPQPLEGYDFFLYRIEGRPERDDWRLPEIDIALTKAASAYLQDNLTEAEAQKTVALTTAIQSPYLAIQDRRRVVQAIKDELATYAGGGQGAVGGQIRNLSEVMAARAIDLKEVLGQPPISFEEVFGN